MRKFAIIIQITIASLAFGCATVNAYVALGVFAGLLAIAIAVLE